MVGKKGSRPVKEEGLPGLERTDNDLEFSTWPQLSMINQKNYYTEYLKRDDQILSLRLQAEENRNRLTKVARERDRALAQNDTVAADTDMDGDENMDDGAQANGESDSAGSKVIVIHPGSQNLRIGLSTDALPKSTPMVIARKSDKNEIELADGEPRPKRRKVDDGSLPDQGEVASDEFPAKFAEMSADLKARMRRKGKRIVPNSKEVAINFNRRTPPDIVPEHNDTSRVEWTEVPTVPSEAPEHYTGMAALRIPEYSIPRYRVSWPIRNGLFNERDYTSKGELLRDISVIIEEAIKTQLGLVRKKEWTQYSCVLVVPDLYERNYVTTMLDLLFRDFGFSRICLIQESLSASFGAGYSTCVVVDVGAQKTSICCVDEGMCVENSRVNLMYGGSDVTETFIKMMLFDALPYAEIDLNRRYDFLLAEELKQRFCTLSVMDIAVQQYEFYLRTFNQNTKHYYFKAYDEVMLAPLGLHVPSIFDNSEKIRGRRKLIDRSYDLYDGSPNDPVSAAQMQILALSSQNGAPDGVMAASNGIAPDSTDNGIAAVKSHIAINGTPAKDSPAVSPDRDDVGTPRPGEAKQVPGGDVLSQSSNALIESAQARDGTVPTVSLVQAISLAIEHGAKGDERKMRDFFGGIMTIGGGAQTPGFNALLEEELAEAQPRFRKEVIVGPVPREIDPQVLVWKGASVFGKLTGTNDTWISSLEYDRLGSRVLAYKTLWSW